ncbi:MAG: DUF952 domain-containing protein [Euzebya sp.]
MTHSQTYVLHAIGRKEWNKAGDPVRPSSLDDEGFIHFSTPAQIAEVCNIHYFGRRDLMLLVIDPARLPEQLVWEDSYDAGQEFPHLYAPLPREAVLTVLDYSPGPKGTFREPIM